MCTDHSWTENSDVENKHTSFENHFHDENQIHWKSHTPLDRCTAHRSALANLINYTYTLIQSTVYHWSSIMPIKRSSGNCAVWITDQKFINLWYFCICCNNWLVSGVSYVFGNAVPETLAYRPQLHRELWRAKINTSVLKMIILTKPI